MADTTLHSGRPRWTEVGNEALAAVFARPSRAILTSFGTLIGVAALILTLGLSQTASAQVISRIDQLASRLITASDPFATDRNIAPALDWGALDSVRTITGVTAAGAYAAVGNDALVRTLLAGGGTSQAPVAVQLVAADRGIFDAAQATITAGRTFDSGHVERADPVAVIGRSIADRLDLADLTLGPSIEIAGRRYLVIGVVERTPNVPLLAESVTIPYTAAARDFADVAPSDVAITTDLAYTQSIGRNTALALNPARPDALTVNVPADITRFRESVRNDLSALLLALAGVSLGVGALGIANITLLSVLERTSEIGLRRALGASRRHVSTQFLLEAAVLGLLGGVIGSSIGITGLVAISRLRGWIPVLSPWVPFIGPAAGIAVGLLAGLYPALRAGRLEPMTALRGT